MTDSGLKPEDEHQAPAPADRPLRVAFASHVAEVWSGAETSLLELVVGLKKDGRIDPIVTVPREGTLASALRTESVPVFVLPTPWWLVWHRGPTSLRKRIRCLVDLVSSLPAWSRWLRRERPDLVVTNTAASASPAVASMLARVAHVWWLREFVTKDHRLDYAIGEKLAQRIIGRLSGYVAVNSRAVRDHYSPPIPRSKMRVIYQGITGYEPTPNQLEPTVRPDEIPALRALLLCRLDSSKGVEVALEAASLVAPEPADAPPDGCTADSSVRPVDLRLRLVGPVYPSYRQRLESQVADLGLRQVVQIKEATPAPQRELEWANVVLVCSDNEAFGRVTVEALKSGRPVVGTRSGGTVEIVSHGVDGLLFTPGDPHALASALSHIAYDPALLATMSENASAGTSGRFTMEEQVETTATLLSQAASEGRRRRGRSRK